MKVFLIEDDDVLRRELKKLLISYGYECEYATDFFNIVEDALKSNSNLIVLDINLPFFDGYHICREIRKVSEVPIIIVTSRNTEMDELMSMNLGADDFITKPYNKQILLARISAILKRTNNNSNCQAIEYKGVKLDYQRGILSHEGKSIELTRNELQIFTVLIQNVGYVVSRDELMDELWRTDEFVDDNTLTVNVNRLRNKLNSIGVEDLIKTKRGQGYIV